MSPLMAKLSPRFIYIAPLLVIVGLVIAGESLRHVNKVEAKTACGAGPELASLIANQKLAFDSESDVLSAVDSQERWVEVDLSEQTLRAWEGNQIYLETPISSGLPWTPTPIGEFRIWIKLRASKMEGGEGNNYYYLPDVPYVMFFANERVDPHLGYGLHGTYWHNDFGTPKSHGCVNLPTNMAEKLYYWTNPNFPPGSSLAYSGNEDQGTRIVIHE